MNPRITARDHSDSELRIAPSAPRRPLTVTLGALVEALTELTDDVDEIVAVIDHVLRTRAVPLGDRIRGAMLGVDAKLAHVPPARPARDQRPA